MDNVFIKTDQLNSWITKYFQNKDLISIDDMISVIEDLGSELEHLQEEAESIINDYPNEEKDREIEVLDI